MITDRVPGLAAGYEIRVANVVEGLLGAGDLRLCLIDASEDESVLPDDDRYERNVVDASEPPRWRRALNAVIGLPNLHFRSPDTVRRRIAEQVDIDDVDLVWFSRIRTHQLAAELFDCPTILDLDDLNDRLQATVISDRRARLGFLRSLPGNIVRGLSQARWKRLYTDVSHQVDRLVVCHEGDRAHLAAPNASVVPNGYPAPDATATTADEPRLLFVGSLDYEPNHLAVRWFLDEVMDRIVAAIPDATVDIVGTHTERYGALEHPAATFHGWVPDVAPFYDRAAVAVAPLRSGGGTRVKIIDAMARSCPVVSTPFACDGLGLNPGHELLMAETPSEFAEACTALLQNREEAAEIAEAASATFSERLDAKYAQAAITALVREALDDSEVT